uniref:Nucleoprotein n=1 Tax=Infectious bronchitis virus TaxID=11120 RepID=A0A023VWD7_9GAMC|nr:nucleocapsid protein [Infectious bronchitis virus]
MASGKATGKTDAPAPIIKLGGPKPPKVGSSGDASWFQAIKAKKLNAPAPKFEGSGVPDNENLKNSQQHGYWRRQARYKPGKGGKKPVPDAWYFYYTGTGPAADLNWGDSQDGIGWVAAKGADVKSRSYQGTRDPDKFDQYPLQFSDGGPDGNFRWDFIPLNRGRSGRSTAVSSAASIKAPSREGSRGRRSGAEDDLIARAAKIIQDQQRKGTRITKQKADEMAHRKFCKRTIPPGYTVNQVLGPRTKGKERNFGDDKMNEEGIKDGRVTAMLNLTPSPHACLFGSTVTHKLRSDGLHLKFEFTTVGPRDDPQFDNYVKICDERVDGVCTRPKDEVVRPKSRSSSRPATRGNSPAPKQQRYKKEKKPKKQDDEVDKALTSDEERNNAQLEFDDEPKVINWGDSALGENEL